MIKTQNKKDIDIHKKNLINKGMTFSIIDKSGNRSIFVDKKPMIVMTSKSKEIAKYFGKKKAGGAIHYIHKDIWSRLLQERFELKELKAEYPSQDHNADLFESLPIGTELAYIDINHCYWRVAYLLGYISKRIYDKYKDDAEMKLARNIALSTLASTKKKHSYFYGRFNNTTHCDSYHLPLMYKNIRYFTYNTLGEIAVSIPDGCVSYRTDGIIVLNDKQLVNYTQNYFRKKRFTFETEIFKKVGEKEIQSTLDGKIKKY